MSNTNRKRLAPKLVMGICALAAYVALGTASSGAQQVQVASQTDQPDPAPHKPTKRSANALASAAMPNVGAAEKPVRRASQPTKGPYYVDFRARTAATYGHAFVWFGRTGDKKVEVAGLHPAGDEVPYVLGHLTFVPAETGASYGDLDVQYLTASYRVYLNEEDAKKVFAYIKHLQETSPLWNAETVNCTAFLGRIANFMGMKAPFHLQKPENYVNELKEINGGRQFVQLSNDD